MAKWKIEAREIIYHDIIIEADSLDDAYNWINCKQIEDRECGDIEWETDDVAPACIESFHQYLESIIKKKKVR
tara:strand:- start:384 stop:602 length:219 start_codon:yes stop_codon:yes gene_type:complete